jgi:hypothetical protein
VYERTARLPVDENFDRPLPQPQDPESYLVQLQRKRQLAKETVEATMAAAQETQKHYYGQANHNPYSLGDLVYLFYPVTGKNRKLRNPWTGPFKVVGKHGQSNTLVQPVSGGRRQTVHYNRLKPYYRRHVREKPTGTPPETTQGPTPPEPITDTDNFLDDDDDGVDMNYELPRPPPSVDTDSDNGTTPAQGSDHPVLRPAQPAEERSDVLDGQQDTTLPLETMQETQQETTPSQETILETRLENPPANLETVNSSSL